MSNDLHGITWNSDKKPDTDGLVATDQGNVKIANTNVRENIWNEPTKVQRYIVKVNGVAMSPPQLVNECQQFINTLAPEAQASAQIVEVDEQGREILMG